MSTEVPLYRQFSMSLHCHVVITAEQEKEPLLPQSPHRTADSRNQYESGKSLSDAAVNVAPLTRRRPSVVIFNLLLYTYKILYTVNLLISRASLTETTSLLTPTPGPNSHHTLTSPPPYTFYQVSNWYNIDLTYGKGRHTYMWRVLVTLDMSRVL